MALLAPNTVNSERSPYTYFREKYTPLQYGIDLHREVYKKAMLNKDYMAAVIALGNIKAEIQYKAIAKGNKDLVIRINNILQWYYKLPQKYSTKTPEGSEIMYPADIEVQIINNFTAAYSHIMKLLQTLGLIQ